jgi:hypothetical protein
VPVQIKHLDFRFENSLVKAVANRNYPETQLAGLTVGPFEEGNEYEIYFWVAKKLAEAGIVHFREEDRFGATELYKVQWKERVQVAGQISEQLEKMQEHEKSKQLACDIVNSRLRKIIALSSGPIQADQLTKRMTKEERLIYDRLEKLITHWRNRILQYEEGEQ